ncbi:hypothetical protein [Streptomyces sp. BBFR102]|uniref:hypothetical protein n=1 Tax=Streptomyces sp. BBFR102 TaxID=3448171 RepID=UPI003F538799
MHTHENAKAAEVRGGRASACAPSAARPTPLLRLQTTAGNAAVVQMLRQAGHPWAQPAAPRPPAVVQRVGEAPDPAVESEYRLGVAATLERTINDDVKDRLGAEGLHLSIGGGGGVAALRAERPVQDLDLRLHISGAQGADPEFRQEVITYLQALLQDKADDTVGGTTVRGTFGGAEVSVTLGEVPTQTRDMYVHESPARVPLTVVAPLRLFTDKVAAFATRKEKEGEDLVEKRQRDARDLLTLYPQVTAGNGLADVLTAHLDDQQLIHQGLKKAAPFKQQLDRYKKDHPDTFDDQQWTLLREIARILADVAKQQRKPKGEAAAQQAGESSNTSKEAKRARRQQRLAER